MASALSKVTVLVLLSLLSIPGLHALCNPCPFQWLPFGGHCYRLVLETLQWQEAEKYCQSLPHRRHGPAHLVAINSEEEQQFLAGYAQVTRQATSFSYFWIGLNDIDHEGQYVWVGTSIGESENQGFRNWISAGHTYPGHSNYDCALTHSSHGWKWFQHPCSYRYFFVCEVEQL